MTKAKNRIVTNRKSPKNERNYIESYLAQNPSAKKRDNLDVSAVKDKTGTRGHALLKQEINRSKDGKPHRGQAFIPDSQLNKTIKKK
jgi:hypothetical protein